MNEEEIILTYNDKKVDAVVSFSFVPGCSGYFSGAPENCLNSTGNEYELETLEIKLSTEWLNKSSMLSYFENQIIDQLESKLRSDYA